MNLIPPPPLAFDLVAGLVTTALKATIVLALFGLLSVLLRRRSAALRHALGAVTAVLLLVLPLAAFLLPPLPIPAPAAWRLDREVPGLLAGGPTGKPTERGDGGADASSGFGNETPKRAESELKPLQAHGAPGVSARTEEGEPASVAQTRTIPWSLLILGIWAIGALSVLGFFAFGCLALRVIERRARAIRDPRWIALLGALCEQLALARIPDLRIDERTHIPMTWGHRRAVVILPGEAREWSESRRRAVLLHELGHIRRRDCMIQDAAHLVSALYWFHPGAWFLAHRLRVEREHACDDLVLAHGAEPADYAHEVLQVARSARRARLPIACPGAALASPSRLETRLVAILDPGRDRRRVSGALGLRIAALSIALITPLAALELAATPQQGTATELAAATEPAAVSSGSLESRWKDAQAAAKGAVWIGYSIPFDGGFEGKETILSDSEGSDLKVLSRIGSEPGLSKQFSIPESDVVVLIQMPKGAGAGSPCERVIVCSATLPLEKSIKPVVWLGRADLGESHDLLASKLRALPDDQRARVHVAAISLHLIPKTGPTLIDLLDGLRGGVVRGQAAEGLARHPGSTGLHALVKHATADADLQVRAESAEALGEMRYAPCTDALIVLAKQADDVHVRSEAVESLGEREPERALPVLITIAREDPSETVRREAVETLGDLPGRVGVSALRYMAENDPDPAVRDEAIETLGDMREKEYEDRDEDKSNSGSGARKSPAGTYDPGGVEARSMDAHSAAPHSLARLRDLALHGDKPVERGEAIEALAAFHPAAAAPVLMRIAWKDPDPSVRSEAIETLGDLRNHAGVPLLEDLAKRHPDRAGRAEALETLHRVAPERALAVLDQ